MSDPIEKSLFEAPPIAEQERMVEAILFASTEPMTVAVSPAKSADTAIVWWPFDVPRELA